ncbi:glycine cleavage system protein H [[Eubacterium] cellulosolvens]
MVNQALLLLKEDSLYTPKHTWVRITNNKTVEVGLSRYICNILEKFSGSKFLLFRYFNLLQCGAEAKRMKTFGSVNTKSRVTFNLILPLSGKIKKVNTQVIDNPYLLNKNPEETWIVKIEPTYLEEESNLLLNLDQYKEICKRCDGISASSFKHFFDELTSEWHVHSSKLFIKNE